MIATGNDWRVKRWHTVEGRLRPAEPPFLLEVEFDKPFVDLRHGELMGKGYESVEHALQDGINKEDVRRALGGETVPQVKVRVAEWDLRGPTESTGNQLARDEEGTLEEWVDSHGMEAVIRSLETIADGKADHLRSNWQDERGARQWEKVAKELDRFAEKMKDISPL